MCKMSLCGLAILAAVWLGAGCSGTGLKPGRSTAGAGGTTNGPGGGGVGGATIGAGGVVAGGVSGASGGMSGTSSCIMTECIGPLPCVPASQPRPNLCGCPIPTCEPDAGAGGAAGTATGGAISTGGTGGATILDAGSAGCTWQGSLIAVGQHVDAGDGCNTCTCTVAGMACTTRACFPVDAPTLVCSLTSALTFGSDGGKVFRQDSYTLDGAGHMTVTRYYYGNTDGPNVRTCSPALPACGAAGVVSISTIAQDLGDADVQFAFKLTTSHVYGVDQRPVDGAVWSITRASGGNILVGGQCPSPVMNSCQWIPAGIQRLADDLRSLAFAAADSPACAGL